MTDVQYYVRQADGSPQGPFDVARIRAWIEQGRIRREMAFSTDGVSWVAGASLPDLFPAAASAPVSPPHPPPPPGRRTARRERGSSGRASDLIKKRADEKRALRRAVLPFAIGTVVCAAVATVCAFLPFSKIDVFGDPLFMTGIHSNTGRVLIVAACGGAVAALLALTGQSGRTTMLVAAIALAGALAMMALRVGSPQEFIEAGVDLSLIDLFDLEVTTQPARWAAIAACAVGALLAFIGSMRYAAAERALLRAQESGRSARR